MGRGAVTEIDEINSTDIPSSWTPPEKPYLTFSSAAPLPFGVIALHDWKSGGTTDKDSTGSPLGRRPDGLRVQAEGAPRSVALPDGTFSPITGVIGIRVGGIMEGWEDDCQAVLLSRWGARGVLRSSSTSRSCS
jgi:hypothetical protein